MKKGWKIFWSVCGILAVAGIVLCIAGAVLGGSIRSVEWAVENGLARIGLKQRTFITLTMEEELDYGNGETSSDPDSRESFDGISDIEFDVACVSVQILESEDDRVWVETSDLLSEMEYSCRQEGDKLEIKTNVDIQDMTAAKNRDYFGNIWIFLPECEFDEVDISNTAGITYVRDLKAKEFSLEVGAGEGKVDLFAADEAEFYCGAGTLSIAGEIQRKGTVECDAGSAELKLSGTENEYQFEVENNLGQVLIGREEFGQGNHHLHSGEGSRRVNLECNVGEIAITFE